MMTINFPTWLKVKVPTLHDQLKINKLNVDTICEDAKCPNRAECYRNNIATFMILGNICTRKCKFCNLEKNFSPTNSCINIDKIIYAIKKLELKHVVITSVTRDDLNDGGAGYFTRTISILKSTLSNLSIEVLIPDFKGNETALKKIIEQKPDIISHNIDIVKSLHPHIKPGSSYKLSLKILRTVKNSNNAILTKSFIMLGFGEKYKDVLATIEDLNESKCDILMMGQYLRPSIRNIKVAEYIEPEMFSQYGLIAEKLGFKYVAAGPLVRSSYLSSEIINYIQKNQK